MLYIPTMNYSERVGLHNESINYGHINIPLVDSILISKSKADNNPYYQIFFILTTPGKLGCQHSIHDNAT